MAGAAAWALLVLKNIEDRPPVNASRLDRNVGHAQAVEPVRQLQQVYRHRLECAHVSLYQPIGLRYQNAGDNAFLVDVEPTTSRVSNLHRHFLRPLTVTGRSAKRTQLSLACSSQMGRQHS